MSGEWCDSLYLVAVLSQKIRLGHHAMHKLRRNRLPAKRFGASCRERLRINNWCLRRRFSATTARAPPVPRHLAKLAKRWTAKTNTVFIVAKTSRMAVPVARLSIGLISVQN